MGPKCGIFDAKCCGSIFKIMLPTKAGGTILKKDEKKWMRRKSGHENRQMGGHSGYVGGLGPFKFGNVLPAYAGSIKKK